MTPFKGYISDLQLQDKDYHRVDVGSFMFVVKFCSCSKVSFCFFFGQGIYVKLVLKIKLGGGFTYCSFSSLLGEDAHLD